MIIALSDERWSWYHQQLIETNKQLKVSPGAFDRLIAVFRLASQQHGLDNDVTFALEQLLVNNKDILVKSEQESADEANLSLVDIFNSDSKLEVFIKKFIEKLTKSKRIKQLKEFNLDEYY